MQKLPRTARHKSDQDAYYHLFSRVAGSPKYFPFRNRAVSRKFLRVIRFYLRVYDQKLISFQLMGNHYHMILFFKAFQRLQREELERRARLRWGRKWFKKTRHWGDEDWLRFNRDLFDVSKFMQHINGEFAKWFNRMFGRRGPFWADRFRNPELLDNESVQDCLLYIELNAVRAHLARRPEQWKMGSAYWRWAGKKKDLLVPVEEFFPAQGNQSSFQVYRTLLFYRGAVAREEGQGTIPASILQLEEKRGFCKPGVFARRLRLFTDGVAIGAPQQIREMLAEYRKKGLYRRRRHPIPHLNGLLFTLREQRSHAFSARE